MCYWHLRAKWPCKLSGCTGTRGRRHLPCPSSTPPSTYCLTINHYLLVHVLLHSYARFTTTYLQLYLCWTCAMGTFFQRTAGLWIVFSQCRQHFHHRTVKMWSFKIHCIIPTKPERQLLKSQLYFQNLFVYSRLVFLFWIQIQISSLGHSHDQNSRRSNSHSFRTTLARNSWLRAKVLFGDGKT